MVIFLVFIAISFKEFKLQATSIQNFCLQRHSTGRCFIGLDGFKPLWRKKNQSRRFPSLANQRHRPMGTQKTQPPDSPDCRRHSSSYRFIIFNLDQQTKQHEMGQGRYYGRKRLDNMEHYPIIKNAFSQSQALHLCSGFQFQQKG